MTRFVYSPWNRRHSEETRISWNIYIYSDCLFSSGEMMRNAFVTVARVMMSFKGPTFELSVSYDDRMRMTRVRERGVERELLWNSRAGSSNCVFLSWRHHSVGEERRRRWSCQQEKIKGRWCWWRTTEKEIESDHHHHRMILVSSSLSLHRSGERKIASNNNTLGLLFSHGGLLSLSLFSSRSSSALKSFLSLPFKSWSLQYCFLRRSPRLIPRIGIRVV